MKKTINSVIVILATLVGLGAAWVSFSTYFVSAADVNADHALMQQQDAHARDKLEFQVAGVLKDYSNQQKQFGAEQQQQLQDYRMQQQRINEDRQKQLWDYQQRTRAAQLQSDVRHYEFQVQYYKNMLRKNPEDAIAAADLQLAQNMLAQVKAALRALQEQINK